MGTIKIKRGLSTNLPSRPALGEILYTTDTKRFYIGNGDDAAPTEFGNFAELVTALNGKASADHTHSASDFTNFNDSVDARITAQKGTAAGNLVALDSNGKIPSTLIPSTLIPSTLIPSTFKEAEVCADIDERDALTPFAGLHAFVIDASDDPTVASGGAEYLYNGTAWVKLSELEGLDVSVTWENIGNKPTLVTTLLGLTDTPNSYTNSAGKLLCVNSAGDGVEYTDTFDGGTF